MNGSGLPTPALATLCHEPFFTDGKTYERKLDGERCVAAGVDCIRPELVAETAFTEWTRSGQLRHPRNLGVRRDECPQDVVRESGEPHGR